MSDTYLDWDYLNKYNVITIYRIIQIIYIKKRIKVITLTDHRLFYQAIQLILMLMNYCRDPAL